jgi:hypothetical protein
MGTNYYLHKKPNPACPTCGHQPKGEPLHIGKSSAGWCFSLVAYPVGEGPTSLSEWIDAWNADDVEIRDEYGRAVIPAEMLAVVTERRLAQRPDWAPWEYDRNYAVPGPNNLVRHRVPDAAIAHGDGTYDLCRPGFC